jgi:FkbH-like protein
MPEEEFAAWSQESGCKVWTFRVRDRFGDYGLTGLASLRVVEGHASIVDFLLSCRVFGKNIEDAMFATLVSEARARGATSVTATYIPSTKNKPCLEFLRRIASHCNTDGRTFSWDMGHEFDVPTHIRLVARVTAEAAA